MMRQTYNLFRSQLDSFTNSIKAFRTVLPFLFFIGPTQAYLTKISITHNKYLTLRYFEDNDSVSAKSAVQILNLKIVSAISSLVCFVCLNESTC